jgi:hypothetical protein
MFASLLTVGFVDGGPVGAQEPAPISRASAAGPVLETPAAPDTTPAVSSLSVLSTWGWGGTTRGDLVPLRPGAECRQLDLPGGTLGYLVADNGSRTRVAAACDASDPAAVRLMFPDDPRPGATYTGTVPVLGEDLDVSLRRTTTWWLAVLPLGVGVALGLWLMARGPGRLVATLRARLLQAQAEVGEPGRPGRVIREFERRAGRAAWAELGIHADLARTVTALERDLAALQARKRFTLSDNDAELAALEARIKVVENEVAAIEPLAQELRRLDTHLPAVAASRILQDWVPAVRSELLEGKPNVNVGGISVLLDAARAAAAVAVWWPSVLQQVNAVDQRLEQLEKGVDRPTSEAHQDIRTARRAFRTALGAFERAKNTGQVQAAYDEEFGEALAAMDALRDLEVAVKAGVAGPATELLTELLLPIRPELAQGVTPEGILVQERARSWFAAVAVAALLLFTGLQALYAGKTFGSVWDFLGALAWGAASGAVALPLATAIENYRRVGHP